MKIHVSLSFAQKKDAPLLVFSRGVHDAFVANAAQVTTSPVTAATLDTANTDFSTKMAATVQGGKTATTDKENSRSALLNLLRQIAAWLEGKAQGNVDLITLLGFEWVERGANAQTPLDKPSITAILNSATTQLQLRAVAVANARSYEVQWRIGAGAWTGAGTFPSTRAIVVTGLSPGTLYEFRLRAIGGSTGQSDWSDSVSHMCT